MRSSLTSKIIVTCAVLLLITALPFMVHAQCDVPGTCGETKTEPRSETRRSKTGTTKIKTYTKTVVVTPTTGSLTVVAESQAVITLESLRRNGKAFQATIPAGEKSFIFNDLPPGRYHVVAELNGYKSDEKDLGVRAGKPDKVDLKLVPLTYDVTLNLNVSSGMVGLAKGNEMPDYRPFNDSRVVLPGLRPGKYTIDIKPEGLLYKEKQTAVEVTDKSINMPLNLEKLPSPENFAWTDARDWNLPGNWRIESRKIIVSGSGLGFPSGDTFNYYKDFQLTTDVKMDNGVAVSFAIHEQDPKNYYLIELTGANSDEPYVLRGFIVKNGSLERFGRTYPTNQISNMLKEGKYFRVTMVMNGYDIKVKVEDSETADTATIGILSDPNKTYGYGAVGLVARDNEQYEVGPFIICVSNCQG